MSLCLSFYDSSSLCLVVLKFYVLPEDEDKLTWCEGVGPLEQAAQSGDRVFFSRQIENPPRNYDPGQAVVGALALAGGLDWMTPEVLSA